MLKIKKLFILKKNQFAQLMIYPSVAKHIVYALLVQNVNVQLKNIPGSNAFVPSTVGLIIASEVVKDLTTI